MADETPPPLSNLPDSPGDDDLWEEILNPELDKPLARIFKNSSLLFEASYNQRMKTLWVVFKNSGKGESYVYQDVPVSLVRELFDAEKLGTSAGVIFTSRIRGCFPFKKLKKVEK